MELFSNFFLNTDQNFFQGNHFKKSLTQFFNLRMQMVKLSMYKFQGKLYHKKKSCINPTLFREKKHHTIGSFTHKIFFINL